MRYRGIGLGQGLRRIWMLSLVLAAVLSIADLRAQSPLEVAEEEDYIGSDTCADCHEDQFDGMHASPHGQAADERTPFARHGCETCHGVGEEHAMSEGEEHGALIVFGSESRLPPAAQDRRCLSCHQDIQLMHWPGNAHAAADLGCAHCHKIHQPDRILDKRSEAAVCSACHWQVRAQLHKASAHPVTDNLMTCTDCHNPHGSFGPAGLKAQTVNQSCYGCHAEKRGPLLWEHEPVSDDCSNCHRAHGSNFPALLVRRTPFLCQQCHQGSGRQHWNHLIDYNRGIGVGSGRAKLGAGFNCLNCHSQVHGSNHPSGKALMR